jgi:3-oxoadipate enol-lactonase/4-carboxymuconolactone decarboxylase
MMLGDGVELIPTSGGELAVRLDGPEDAPLLVLSNSLGTTHTMWDPQVGSLAGHFRVLRYDQRGHGGSTTPTKPFTVDELAGDVVEMIEALGRERCSFVGLSLGGMVGMSLAANNQDRVDRLVLASTSPYMGPPETWLERARSTREDGTASLTEMLLGRWFTAPFLPGHTGVAAQFTAMLAEASDEGYALCCEAIAAMDQRSALSRIAAPTLIVAGADDPVASPETALEMHRAIPGSSLAVISHAAHIANVERAEQFTELVLNHLTGTVFERGMRVRRNVLGHGYVDDAVARAATSGNAAVGSFQRLITEGAWGSVWSRPAIDHRTRRLLTLALLAALGRLEEFGVHARAAMEDEGSSGLDAEAIGEVLIHTAVYAGVPAANAALRVLAGLTDPT